MGTEMSRAKRNIRKAGETKNSGVGKAGGSRWDKDPLKGWNSHALQGVETKLPATEGEKKKVN